ncbi:MAG: ASKHA domain-containing protein [Nitrospirae bacterium YQR-1]
MNPIVFRKTISFVEDGYSGNMADVERFVEELGFDCNVEIPLSVMRRLPAALRAERREISAVIAHLDNKIKILDFNTKNIYGLAVDLGSTNIWGRIIDLENSSEIAGAVTANPQRAYGADILSRIFYAMEHGSGEIHKATLDGINNLISKLCDMAKISQNDIYAVTVGANTTMMHFFLNLPVENIPVAPYTPVVHSTGFFTAIGTCLNINTEGVVYLFPNVGSYVGGDIISGILFSGIYKNKGIGILIDMGTNVEIAIGSEDWILAGAGAGGPALDEGIAAAGKTAHDGAIVDVSIDENSLIPSVDTLSGAPAVSICGSGMVSLISELYKNGIIDRMGKLIPGKFGVFRAETENAYALTESLNIYQHEIENFLLSKGAMATLLKTLVGSIGLDFSEIESIILTGAIGNSVNLGHALSIGFLPCLTNEKFHLIRNASLSGAALLLNDITLIKDISHISSIITYKEMNEDRDFMRELPGAVFMP